MLWIIDHDKDLGSTWIICLCEALGASLRPSTLWVSMCSSPLITPLSSWSLLESGSKYFKVPLHTQRVGNVPDQGIVNFGPVCSHDHFTWTGQFAEQTGGNLTTRHKCIHDSFVSSSSWEGRDDSPTLLIIRLNELLDRSRLSVAGSLNHFSSLLL